MSPANATAKAPARPSRELRRAIRRLRWGRPMALWAAPTGTSRQEQLDAALGRLSRKFRVIRIPYGAIPAREVCAFALAALDLPLAGDPERALLEAAAARLAAGERLVLAIEETDHMPLVEVTRLRQLIDRAQGALRLLVVASAGSEEARLGAALGVPGKGLPQPLRDPVAGPASAGKRLRRVEAPAPADREAPPEAVPPTGARSGPTPYTYAAADEALEALARFLRGGGRTVALLGPPGIGKTVVLRRLAGALADAFDPLWVPGLALSGDQLLRWMVYCRRGWDPSGDPRDSWRREVARARAAGRDLLVLLDDAGALLPEAAAGLGEEIRRGEGALRIALSLCEGRYRDGGEGALSDLHRIRLAAPLSPAESVAFLRTQLGGGLDADLMARVVDDAGGVPAALLRGMTARLAGRAPLLAPAGRPADA